MYEGEVIDVDGLADRVKAFFKEHDLPKRIRLGVASQKIALRVLELPMRRYLAIQMFAQLLALTGGLVAGLGFVMPQLMALAGIAIVALLAFWLPSMGPARRRDD